MRIAKSIASLALLAFAVMAFSGPSPRGVFERKFQDHAFFAGTYDQTHVFGCSDDYSFEGFGVSDDEEVVKFGVESREVEVVTASWDGRVQSENAFAPDFDDYEFKDFNPSAYPSFDEPFNSDFRGPKRPYDNSICKIRAYYHDVQGPDGLVTVMIDSTGFVVGESLVMSAAHGFYRDVTVDFLDDGIDNPVFPGDVEIYGAIGLGDVWGEDYAYFSEATEIFMTHSYVSDCSESDDWCLLRTKDPLGRELTVSRLVNIWGNSLNGNASISGYPMWNQWCQTLPASDVYSDYLNLWHYDCMSFPGMSGAPVKAPEDRNVVRFCNNANCRTERAVFAIHTSFDGAGTGRAIPVNGFMVGLVDSLNRHNRPSVLTFASLSGSAIGRPMSRDSIDFDELGSCAIQGSNCGEGGEKIALGLPSSTARSAYLDMEFEVPMQSVSLQFSSGAITSDVSVRLEIEAWDGGLSVIDLAASGRPLVDLASVYTAATPAAGERIRRLRFIMSRSGRYSFGIKPIRAVPDWHYRPTNGSELAFGNDFVDWGESHNCVSYALNIESVFSEGTTVPDCYTNLSGYCPGYHNGHILRHDDNEFSPGNILNALKTDLHADNIDFVRVGKFDVCPPGMYKIAIVFDPYNYYHLLRQNSDGTWSHYFWRGGVFGVDSDNIVIMDPEEMVMMSDSARYGFSRFYGANNYSEKFDITSFGGYYGVDNRLKVNVYEHQ